MFLSEMITIGSIVSLILIFIPTITGDNVVERTFDNGYTLENFTEYSAKHGANVDTLRLIGNVGNLTAELFKLFPDLIKVEIILWNIEPVVQQDIFRYNVKLTSIVVQYGHFDDGDFLQLNHLHNLKKLELFHVAFAVSISKKLLDLPSLTHLLIVGENVTATDDVFEKMPNLEYVEIGGSNSKRLPSSLSKLAHLQTLYFKDSSITELRSDDLNRSSQSLAVLDMNFGKLIKISLPKSMPNLQTLNLGGNQLTDIPDRLFDATPSLKEIVMYKNKLTKFRVSSIARLNQLTLLDLSENNLEEFNVTYGKGQQQQLQTLVLSHNRLKLVRIPKVNGILQLNDNQISRIDRNTFSSGSVFRFFYLSSNPIVEFGPRSFDNITLPYDVEFSNISASEFSLDCLNNAGGVQYLVLTGNPYLQRITASNSTKLPGKFQAIVLRQNANLSFVDPDGQLERISQNSTLFWLSDSFLCTCELKPLLDDSSKFVDVDFVTGEPRCSNANQLTVKSFLTDNEKYCKGGKLTKRFPVKVPDAQRML